MRAVWFRRVDGGLFYPFKYLLSLGLCCPATFADIAGDQFAALAVEGVALHDLPFMEAAFAQGLALVLFARFGTLEADDVSHAVLLILRPPLGNLYNSVPLSMTGNRDNGNFDCCTWLARCRVGWLLS